MTLRAVREGAVVHKKIIIAHRVTISTIFNCNSLSELTCGCCGEISLNSDN